MPSEDGRPPKRERRITDYSFLMRQEEDEDSDGQVDFINAKVKFEGATVGRLSGYLFHRDGEFAGGFYDTCDAICSETQECSVLFFKDTGRLQREFARTVSRTCNTGGFLYIESIEVDEEHRRQGLGLLLLQKCLNDIENWSIAIMLPFPLNLNGQQADADFATGITSLGRHFARLGFHQCDSNPVSERTKFWYLEECNYHGDILETESVQDLEVVHPSSKPVLNDLTKEIREIIMQGSEEVMYGPGAAVPVVTENDVSQFKENISAVLARGGNLDESGALHFAVANQKDEFLRPLVELGKLNNGGDTSVHSINTDRHLRAFILSRREHQPRRPRRPHSSAHRCEWVPHQQRGAAAAAGRRQEGQKQRRTDPRPAGARREEELGKVLFVP